MAKQVHIRLDDAVYEALAGYNDENNTSVQDAVSSAIIQFLKQQNKVNDKKDDAYGKVSVQQNVIVAKTVETKAAETAEMILKLRRQRL